MITGRLVEAVHDVYCHTCLIRCELYLSLPLLAVSHADIAIYVTTHIVSEVFLPVYAARFTKLMRYRGLSDNSSRK